MIWPENPTCHEGAPRPPLTEYAWQTCMLQAPWDGAPPPPTPNAAEPFRRCNYCGSIHPGDLVKLYDEGAVLSFELADMKYGWPHKVYLRGISHEHEHDVQRIVSAIYKGSKTPTDFVWRPVGKIGAKFYTKHLFDRGYSSDAIGKLISMLHATIGVLFTVETGRLGWKL